MLARRPVRLSRRRQRERLHSVIAALRERYGPNIIRSGAELAALPAAGDGLRLSTGSLGLDLATGGLPRGAITEYAGVDGAGKESLALAALVACQRAHGVALLADLDGACDPDALADAGVDLDQLVLACPGSARAAWHILSAMSRCSALDLIVVFSLAGLLALPDGTRRPRLARGLARLRVALRGSVTTLLVTNYPLPPRAYEVASLSSGSWPTVGGEALAQAARLRVALFPTGIRCTPYGDVQALCATAWVVKHHGLAQGDGLPLEIGAAGPRRAAELVALARRLGLLTETALGLLWGERLLGRGDARAATTLEADARLAHDLDLCIRAAWTAVPHGASALAMAGRR